MKKIILLAIAAVSFLQCSKKEDPFLIQKDKIGVLARDYTLKQIDSVFTNDSIVKRTTDDAFTGNTDDIEVFEKGGKHLLSLSPNDESTINIVTIHDSRFHTDKGINTKSTFKEYRTNYKVSKIDRILNNINVEFENQDFYITIDVNQLPGEYQFDYSVSIEEVSIPDGAKIKSLQLDWF